MRQPTLLRVHANPYAHLDHEGRPDGRVLLDPEHHNPYASDTEPRRYVGCALDTEKTTILKKAPRGANGEMLSGSYDLQDTVWKFSAEPQLVPMTAYYLDRLRDRELLPADAATARHANLPFVHYDKAIEQAKIGALALWFRDRPDHFVPDWAEPEHLETVHHCPDETKRAHAAACAAKSLPPVLASSTSFDEVK